MKQQILRFSFRLVLFTIVLYLIQYLVVNHLIEDISFFYYSYAIYLFHFISTLLIYSLLVVIDNYFKDHAGFAFMGASLLKMLAAIIFLFPMLQNYTGNVFANLLSFFIPYFLYLVFETLYAVKLINPR